MTLRLYLFGAKKNHSKVFALSKEVKIPERGILKRQNDQKLEKDTEEKEIFAGRKWHTNRQLMKKGMRKSYLCILEYRYLYIETWKHISVSFIVLSYFSFKTWAFHYFYCKWMSVLSKSCGMWTHMQRTSATQSLQKKLLLLQKINFSLSMGTWHLKSE